MRSLLIALFINWVAIGCAQELKPSRENLLTHIIPSSAEVLSVQTVKIPKGVQSPLHLHPGDVVGYILSGKVLFQIQGQKPEILEKGQVFLEPANTQIPHFDNISESEDLIFLALYLKENPNDPEVQILPTTKN